MRRRAIEVTFAPAFLLGGAAQVLAVGLGSASLAAVGLVFGSVVDLASADEVGEWRGRLRRVGLGVVQRATLRSLLVLAVVASRGTSPGVAMLFVIAVAGAVLASRLWRWSLDKVVAQEPAMAIRNLGAADHSLTDVIEGARRARTIGSGALVAAEVPIGLAVLGAASGVVEDLTARVILGAITLVVLGVAGAALAWSVHFRRTGRVERHLAALRQELERHAAPVILYFSGVEGTTYQVNQWIPVFDRLSVPVLVVIRERHHLDALLPTRWPVLYCRQTRDVEVALTSSVRAAFYVANSGRNIHLQRFAQVKHVFLNHGDSDKASSANPVVRVYDRLFVAGEIGIERYQQGGVDLPRDRFEVVGRPQLDGVRPEPIPVGDGPLTVLYAPTWEGFFDEADYSSIERMGVELVEAILAHRDDLRIVFKPHPATGTVRPSARAAMRRIEARLRRAGAPHVLAADEPATDLLAWFRRTDVLVSDISAVVTDWLATGRPYLVTNPRGLSVEEFDRAYPSHTAAYRVDPSLERIPAALDAALGDDPLAAARDLMRVRVLGDHPHGPQATFDRAVRQVIGQRGAAAGADRERR